MTPLSGMLRGGAERARLGLLPHPAARSSLSLPRLPARPASWEPTGLRLRPYWSAQRGFPAGRRRHAV